MPSHSRTQAWLSLTLHGQWRLRRDVDEAGTNCMRDGPAGSTAATTITRCAERNGEAVVRGVLQSCQHISHRLNRSEPHHACSHDHLSGQGVQPAQGGAQKDGGMLRVAVLASTEYMLLTLWQLSGPQGSDIMPCLACTKQPSAHQVSQQSTRKMRRMGGWVGGWMDGRVVDGRGVSQVPTHPPHPLAKPDIHPGTHPATHPSGHLTFCLCTCTPPTPIVQPSTPTTRTYTTPPALNHPPTTSPVWRLVPQEVQVTNTLQLALINAVMVDVVCHPVGHHHAQDDAKHELNAARALDHQHH